MKTLLTSPERKCFVYNSLQQMYQGAKSADLVKLPDDTEEAGLIVFNEKYKARFFRSAVDLPDAWDRILRPEQFFLSRRYLSTFEDYAPKDVSFAYLAIYKEDALAAGLSFQMLTFNTVERLRSLQYTTDDKGWKLLRKRFLRAILGRFNFNLLISGATQFSGEHGIAINTDLVEQNELFNLLDRGISLCRDVLKQQGWKADGVLVKDYFEAFDAETITTYNPFPFMPNMVMDIHPDWKNYQDYLAAMTSKYRMRAKRAVKKAKDIDVKELGLEEIQALSDRMYELYSEIEEGADFSLIKVPANYFLGLKENLPDKFRVIGYFKEGELIGYCTTLRNGPELEAHFLGFHSADNYSYQLYLNMLYKMVDMAIEEGVERLVFARTASAIKSSVGAEPYNMHCYIRHFSPIVNRWIPFLVGRFQPEEEWIQRHPFGKE